MGQHTPGPPTAPDGKRNNREPGLRQQLSDSIERYELLARATTDIVYDLDLRKLTVVWNDALYTKYGYDRDEPAGTLKWWTSHIHPGDALRVENEISGLAKGTDSTWHSRYRFRKADGDYAIVSNRAFVQCSPGGQPRRIIGSMLDITEMVKLERAKSEFSSLVSHQLRTPLTVIQFYSTMLADGVLGPMTEEQKQHVRRINAASNRLLKLASNILNISRIELDRVHLDSVLTDLCGLTREIIAQLQPLADEQGVTVSLRPTKALPSLHVDRSVYAEVMTIVLANAISYTPAGGRADVSLSRTKGGYTVRVKDTGIGIPAADQPHIFSRFYRAGNAAQTGVEGTGLGLYLAKLLMDVTGGDISFRSREGAGTTFFIRLPGEGMAARKRLLGN